MREIFEEIKKDMDDFFTEIDAIIYDDNDDDELPTSDCCGAELIYNDQLCGDCKEHV